MRLGFPIIEDVGMKIGQAYGMIHPSATSTSAMRSVFFIDPEGIVRTILTYPMQIGRSIEEILRVLKALKATAQAQASAPAGWQPGDDLVGQDLQALEATFTPTWGHDPAREQ